jgi:hypothetical protein
LAPDLAVLTKKKTKVVDDTNEPDFEEVFTLPLTADMSHVRVELRDDDGLGKSESLGCVHLPVGPLTCEFCFGSRQAFDANPHALL